MGFKALLYAYILGGITFIPLLLGALVFITIYTSVPVGDLDVAKRTRGRLEGAHEDENEDATAANTTTEPSSIGEVHDLPRSRKGWLTMRRTFEESQFDGGYVTLVRSFLDARSKDPKRSRPKDMWYVVLKGKVLYLYEDEGMVECEAVIELGGHEVLIYPEGLLDGELFAKRNAICLRPKVSEDKGMPSVTKVMKLGEEDLETALAESDASPTKKDKAREKFDEAEKVKEAAREEAFNQDTPWFIFVRSNVEMEDWYFALIHASDHPAQTPTLEPLQQVFQPVDMNHLVSTLDEQPDVIPMRWMNAILGRLFYSFYRTDHLESFIIGRLMKKLSKVKRPGFLQDIVVTEFSVGNKTPTFSKPMLKELTKEGDASMEVHVQYKGELRATVEATATISIGTFKSYTVKLVLAAVLKELEGNLLVRVKRPPSNRIWYAFTQTPKMVISVEPIVSDRQITWGMILSSIEARLVEIIEESVVMPNMDDIAFFESNEQGHRGGIWADAARRVRAPVSGEVPAEGGITTEVDANIETSDSIRKEADTEPAPIVQRSQSAQESSASSSVIPDPPPVAPSSTFPLPSSDDSSKANRRKSWFSSVRNGDVDSSDPPNESEGETPRGRATDLEPSAVAPRSQSTPGKAESLQSAVSDAEASEDSTHLHPTSSRRSSSHHSTRQQDPIEPSTLTREASRNTSSSPTSFLSTLKSRAGDKQALSNSAKEAMRKWGVNWGGLKKDSTESEMPDHGLVGSRERTESLNTVAQRTSYAEVRAAVAERKNKETLHPQGERSSPISIPGSSRARVTSGTYSSTSAGSSTSSSGLGDGVTSPSLKSNPSQMNGSDDLEVPVVHPPIHVQPQAKTMSIPGIHASHRGDIQSMGYVAPPASPPPNDSKLKNPVYRLWKGPNSTSNSASTESSSASTPTPPQTVDTTASPISPSRPTPPPLPPRRPTSNRTSSISISRPPLEPTTLSSTSSDPTSAQSSATETLKSIATKDENTRNSIEITRRRADSQSESGSSNSSSSPPRVAAIPSVSTLQASA